MGFATPTFVKPFDACINFRRHLNRHDERVGLSIGWLVGLLFVLMCFACQTSKPTGTEPKPPSVQRLVEAMKAADSLNQVTADSIAPPVLTDSIFATRLDSSLSKSDSLRPVSSDELDTIIVYTAKDSIIYDLANKTMSLFGDAKITYQEFRLNAPKVVIDTRINILDAESNRDSANKPIDVPKFSDAGGTYDAVKMSYNFKTKRGKIREVTTELDNGYYSGENIKRMEDGVLNVKNGRYYTCNHDPPHYWFQCESMKLIPGDRVIARPVVMYVEGVPVFYLPFAFFLTRSGRQSGLIMPRYGRDNFRGFFLAQGGYYWALSDYYDLRLEGDVGTFGSWATRGRFRYKERYDLDGTIDGQFERLVRGEITDPDYLRNDNWYINIQHQQRFDPTTQLSGNLRFAGGNQFSVNSFNPIDALQQQAASTLTLTKTFAEGQRSTTIGYSRNQNLRVTDISQSITASFYQARLFPFKGRKSTDGFLERIAIDLPNTSVSGNYNNTDTTFSRTLNGAFNSTVSYQFSPQSNYLLSQGFALNASQTSRTGIEDLSGASLTMPLSFSGTLFRYFNANVAFTYNQFFNDRSITRFFNPTDSIIVTQVNRRLTRYYTYQFSTGVQTRLYGTLFTGFLENLVGLKAVRHTLNPIISYNFNPDFTREEFGYFGSYIDANGERIRYNRFEGALFSNVPTESQSLNLNLNNIFEAKVRSLDTTKAIDDPERTEKKVQFLNANVSTAYNFAARDGFNWSNVNVSANSTTIPNLSLNANASFSFYGFNDSTGATIPVLNRAQGGGVLRFLSGNLQLSTGFRGERKQNPDRLIQQDSARLVGQGQLQNQNTLNGLPQTDFRSLGQNVDFDVPWDLNFGLNIQANRQNPLLPVQYDAQLSASGGISITPNWQLRGSLTYLFRQKQFVAPQISINRDLHCWTMSFQWTPVGQFRSYFFTLQVKAPQLRDIRIEQNEPSQNLFGD
ncbi:MAG: putative LPS assembly protein LptD [Chloroherpetonaceae bacterium]